jgi:hypothetical protein
MLRGHRPGAGVAVSDPAGSIGALRSGAGFAHPPVTTGEATIYGGTSGVALALALAVIAVLITRRPSPHVSQALRADSKRDPDLHQHPSRR